MVTNIIIIAAQVIGGIVPISIFSLVVGFVIFPKVSPPKKHLFTVTVAYVVYVVLVISALPEKSNHNISLALILSGMSAIILLFIQIAMFYVKQKRR